MAKNDSSSNSDEWETVPARGRRSRKRDHSDNDNDDGGGDVVVYSPPSQRPCGGRPCRPFVLVLVGIPGSGKSHFASRLEASMPWKFVRINQDSLKTRRKCEDLARRTLSEGKVAVIDRTNFNVDQRKTWIDIAQENNVQCECIVFEYDTSICITRCQQRTGHETVHPSKAAMVVSFLAPKYRPPVPRARNGCHVQCSGGERFHRLEHVSSFNMADNLAERYLSQR